MEIDVKYHNLPTIIVTTYFDTRVSFASKLFGTLIANHYTYKLISHEDFPKGFDMFSAEYSKTMQEMGAILSALAAYAVNEAQISGAFCFILGAILLLGTSCRHQEEEIQSDGHGSTRKIYKTTPDMKGDKKARRFHSRGQEICVLGSADIPGPLNND